LEGLFELLVKLRDSFLEAAEALNKYVETPMPQFVSDEKQAAAVIEEIFLNLKFEPQQGVKLGTYEIAFESRNLADKWRPAYAILRNSNSTIKERCHGDGYVYAYWLYGEGKIYRQKLTPRR